jgi:hypothetical protein
LRTGAVRYRAKLELYDEYENRVEVEWTEMMLPDSPSWRKATWDLALKLVEWLRERRA